MGEREREEPRSSQSCQVFRNRYAADKTSPPVEWWIPSLDMAPMGKIFRPADPRFGDPVARGGRNIPGFPEVYSGSDESGADLQLPETAGG